MLLYRPVLLGVFFLLGSTRHLAVLKGLNRRKQQQQDLSNYEQAFIAACVVYVAFVLASPRGKNILQDELAAKLIIKMNGYSDSPVDFSDYVWLLSFFFFGSWEDQLKLLKVMAVLFYTGRKLATDDSYMVHMIMNHNCTSLLCRYICY